MMLCHTELPSRKDLLPFHAACQQHIAFPCQLLQRLLQLYITSPEVMPCPGQPSSMERARQGDKGTVILAKCGHRTSPTGHICSRTSQQLPIGPVLWCGVSLSPLPLPPTLPSQILVPNKYLPPQTPSHCPLQENPAVKLPINAYWIYEWVKQRIRMYFKN